MLHFPETDPRYCVNRIVSVLELVALGLGAGVVPLLLADGRSDVARLTEVLDECSVKLYLVTHPARISASAPACCGVVAFGSGAKHAVRFG